MVDGSAESTNAGLDRFLPPPLTIRLVESTEINALKLLFDNTIRLVAPLCWTGPIDNGY